LACIAVVTISEAALAQTSKSRSGKFLSRMNRM